MEETGKVSHSPTLETSLGKQILIFLMHQVLGSWGVAFLTTLTFNLFLMCLGVFGSSPSGMRIYRLLTNTPYFPMQVVMGMYAGWLLGRRLRHRSMQWSWVLPLIVLCYAVFEIPTISSAFTSVLLESGVNQSRWSHYFGWGCRPKDRCFDQLFFTMPFYASVGYSIGALVARKMPANS
jgi:hypothetical protein